jgi:tetratricopeptide (TPR) repeat protein
MRPKPWIGEVGRRPATLIPLAPGSTPATSRCSTGFAQASPSRCVDSVHSMRTAQRSRWATAIRPRCTRRSAICTRCAASIAPALATYEAAAAVAGRDRLGTIEHKLGRVQDRRGDHELAERHLAEALRLDGESARLQADRSLAAHRRGRAGQAVEFARRALELGEGDTEAVAQAENILGMLTREPAHLERSVVLAETLDDRSVLVAALNNLALACERADQRDRAIDLTERALRLCSEQGDRHREAALNNNLADLLHRAGREDDSMNHLKQAVTIFAEIGSDEGGMQPEVWKLVEW